MKPLIFVLMMTVLTAAIPLAICVLLEFISPRTRYRLRDRFPGSLFIIFLPVFAVLTAIPIQALLRYAGVDPIANLSAVGIVGVLFVTIVLKDFLNYWQHRFDHWALWPIHSVHHSQTDLHAANGYAHPFQAFSEILFIAIPLSLIQVGSLAYPIALGLSFLVILQTMIIHSPLNVHLGPLRRIIVDNRFHRIHHSLEDRHFDKNFGTIFTVWDQLFGTAYFPAEDEWPNVGVAGLHPPTTIWAYLIAPVHVMKRRYPHAAQDKIEQVKNDRLGSAEESFLGSQ